MPTLIQDAGRPSGLSLDADLPGPIASEVAELDERGRIRLPPRLTAKVSWFSSGSFDCLMILERPGVIVLMNWGNADKVIKLRRELVAEFEREPSEFHTLRLLEDRYHRLRIPDDRRPTLGTYAITHLSAERLSKVYVFAMPERIEIVSPAIRNEWHTSVISDFTSLP